MTDVYGKDPLMDAVHEVRQAFRDLEEYYEETTDVDVCLREVYRRAGVGPEALDEAPPQH